MPVKHIAKKGKTQLPAWESEDRFADKDAQERYESWMKERHLFPEHGFPMKKMPLELMAVIEQHRWGKFCCHPTNPVVSVVREFYAGIPVVDEGKKEPRYSQVRGVRVPFDAKRISEVYNLQYSGKGFEKVMKGLTEAKMDEIKEKITVPRTVWAKKKGNDYRITRTELLPHAKISYSFITHSILPTTHNQTIDKERIVLLHQLLEGKPIEVPKLIERELLLCARRGKGCLFFPCLVTNLCKQEGVTVYGGEETWPVAKSLDKTTISSHNIGPTPRMLSQFMKNQQAFWQFSKEQFTWQKRLFNLNFPKKMGNRPPVFPGWILEPLDTSTHDDTIPEDTSGASTPKKKKPKQASKKGKEKVLSEDEVESPQESLGEEEFEEVLTKDDAEATKKGEERTVESEQQQVPEKETEAPVIPNEEIAKVVVPEDATEAVIEKEQEKVPESSAEFFDATDATPVTTPPQKGTEQEKAQEQREDVDLEAAVAAAVAGATTTPVILEDVQPLAMVVYEGHIADDWSPPPPPPTHQSPPAKKAKKSRKKKRADKEVIEVNDESEEETLAELRKKKPKRTRFSDRLRAGVFSP